jgi:cytochrome c peroxidase
MDRGILHYLDDAGRDPGISWRPRMVRSSAIVRSLRLWVVTVALAVASVALAGCGASADDLFCDSAGCGFSDLAWSRLSALANPGPVPIDASNAVFGTDRANLLGQWSFFDTRFSGVATQVDAIGRPTGVARAAKGQPLNISCASCHDLDRMGVDAASTPGNVSSGAGFTDVNALSVVDSAYSHLYFWNGRADSSWALAFAVAESATTMNGNRLQTAHVLADADQYRSQYDGTFGSTLGQTIPIPPEQSTCAISQVIVKSGPNAGQCLDCSLPGCRLAIPANGGPGVCWPRFPLQGKPGSKMGCQPGDPTEPFGDAFDCMDPADQAAVTQVLVNWSKALESFEAKLVNVEGTPFDAWIAEGPLSAVVDESARRGAQLFVGKGGCVDCHNGPMLTDGGFHNIGVAQRGANVPTLADCPEGGTCDCVTPTSTTCAPWGKFTGLERLQSMKNKNFLRTGPFSNDKTDTSRAADVAAMATDDMKGAWRTPSLRNVAETAPYMHDGRYASLEEVVAHYNRGGDPDAVGTVDIRIRPLLLTDGEQADLVAFLRTLTGPPIAMEDRVPAFPIPAAPVCP